MARIIGNNFPNFLRGTGGQDVIMGLASTDVLLGLGGNDKLYGGSGQDFLQGGKGRDDLWGGGARDVFKFKIGDGFWNSNTGKWDDVVYDYRDGRDVFDVPGGGGLGSVTLRQVFDGPHGGGTEVAYGFLGGGFFVKNYFAGQWSNDDFI